MTIFGLNISLIIPILMNIISSILIISIVILSCTIKNKTSFTVPHIVQLLIVNLIQSVSYIPEIMIETDTMTGSAIKEVSFLCQCFAFVPSNLSSIFWILIITIKLYNTLARAQTLINNKTMRQLLLFAICYLFPMLCGLVLYFIVYFTQPNINMTAVNIFNYSTYGISVVVMIIIIVLYVLLMVELRQNSYKEALKDIMRVVLNVLMFSVIEIVYLILYFIKT